MRDFLAKKVKTSTQTHSENDQPSASEQYSKVSQATIDQALEKSIVVQRIDSKPIDISQRGQQKSTQKFEGFTFPKNADGRSFQPKWIDTFEWIEYSEQTDKVYCYACRQFATINTNDVFTSGGFNAWKTALSTGKGLRRHAASANHIGAMLSWKECQSRTNTNTQVSTLLNESVLEKRRYYFKAIVKTILFLVKCELPFRGNWESDENVELGIFQNLFQYTLESDEYLRKCQESMPGNALYTSPKIQNELIHIIANVLRENIVAEMNESTYLTLMADGTTDKNGIEVYSIAFRYLKNGSPVETLLTIEKADDISAVGISNLLINCIEINGIDDRKIIDQCYDGAPVMEGEYGGVQALIQKHYNRVIPYVHCFNHRLHLVVMDVLKNINPCRLFIGEVKLLHNFFGRFKVRKEYEGTNIPRLIETRWSGHLYAIKSIRKNYNELLETLIKIKEGNGPKFDGDDMALASGLVNSMMKEKFIFMLYALHDLLDVIEPANQILQKRDVGFRLSMPVIDAVLESVQSLRTDEAYNSFHQLVEETASAFDYAPRPRRIRQRSSRLTDSIVMDTIGEDSRDIGMKSVYFEIIDTICNEIKRRFNNNSDILNALSDLSEMNSNTEINCLKPLEKIGLTLPSEAELKVVSNFLMKEKEKPENADSSNLKILFPVKDAFRATYSLFEACETFGSSTSVNECAFSALARIDIVKRMSMSTQRLCDLSFMAFEKKKLNSVNVDDIIRKFSDKNRKIQLF